MRPRPPLVLAALVLLGCGAAGVRPSTEAPRASPALTLRSTETHLVVLELDADHTVHLGACRIGELRGRRFEGASGESLDFSEASARLGDGRVLVWIDDRVELRTPTGVLSVTVDAEGSVVGANSADGSRGSAARYDALPSDAREPALTLAAVYFFVGREPCEPQTDDLPDYL